MAEPSAWWRATGASTRGWSSNQPLPEVLDSPEGQRLTRATLELELAAGLTSELVRRAEHHAAGTDPGPLPPALERVATDLDAMPEPPAREPVAALEESPAGAEKRTAPEGAEGTKMPRAGMMVVWKGQAKSAKEWSVELGDVTYSGVMSRLKAGKNPDGSPRAEAAPEATPTAKKSKPRRPPVDLAGVNQELSVAFAGPVKKGHEALDVLEVIGIEHQVVARTARGITVFFPG